jgi:multiple sugar transport system ATP-binding protein
MAQVVLDEVTKVFRAGRSARRADPGSTGTMALDRVSLTVNDGEFVVLVGPSGCGKSTLLRIVAGLESATSGTVTIDGMLVNDLPPHERDIAMVFQSYALYPHMTVSGNLGFSLRVRRYDRQDAKARVAETARVLGLEALLDRRPAALSGGQRQRVAMGRSLVRQPSLLLMDEPLSNLDAKLRVAMRGELIRIHRRYRTTTLYVTHDQVEAMTLGDRIAVLDRGRLQQIGTPDELFRTPCNIFVAGFIGSPAMNLARGTLTPGPDGVELRSGPYRATLPADWTTRWPSLVTKVGQDVAFGLRPSAFELVGADDHDGSFAVKATTVESLGDERNVLFLPPFPQDGIGDSDEADSGETAPLWTVRLAPDAPVSFGDTIRLRPRLLAAYFFDPETGDSIAAAAAPPSGDGTAAGPARVAEGAIAATGAVAESAGSDATSDQERQS